MKAIPLISALALAFVPISADAQSSLEPCADFLGDYYRGVDRAIDRAVVGTPRLSITTFPSFSPESGVRLAGDSVQLVELDSSFWYDSTRIDGRGRGRHEFSATRVKTRLYRARVSARLSKRIENAYSLTIARARKSDRMGLDGVTYRFARPGVGCGEAWSPEPGTPNARLVELSELLARHAKLSMPWMIELSEQAIAKSLDRIEH